MYIGCDVTQGQQYYMVSVGNESIKRCTGSGTFFGAVAAHGRLRLFYAVCVQILDDFPNLPWPDIDMRSQSKFMFVCCVVVKSVLLIVSFCTNFFLTEL